MAEELLTVAQAAYLMSAPRRTVEYLIQKGKLETVSSKRKTLIKQTSFISLMKEKTERYAEARKYLASKNTDDTGLTVAKTAQLLHISKQGVYYLIRSGRLEKSEDKRKVIVTLESFSRHISSHEEKYKRAADYIQCNDTFKFWQQSEIEKMYESEQKRRRKK